jgi:hypothetical protein
MAGLLDWARAQKKVPEMKMAIEERTGIVKTTRVGRRASAEGGTIKRRPGMILRLVNKLS